MTARLRLALLVCLLIGSVGVVAAEAELIGYTHLLYLTAENLLAVGTVIALMLAVTLKDAAGVGAPVMVSGMRPVFVAGIMGVISAAASIALVLIYGGDFVPYELLIALLMGAAVGGVSYALLVDVAERRASDVVVSPALYAALALLLIVTGMLRLLAPGSPVLTFVCAPLLYFLLPGLALTFALLPHDARLLDHLVYAAPISIGAQFIAVTWFVQLGIALSPLLFYVTPSAIILLGFALALVRQRHVP